MALRLVFDRPLALPTDDAAASSLVEAARLRLGADTGFVALLGKGQLWMVGRSHCEAKQIPRRLRPVRDDVQAVNCAAMPELRESPLCTGQLDSLRSLVITPVWQGGQVVGTVTVGWRDVRGPVDQGLLAYMEQMARVAGDLLLTVPALRLAQRAVADPAACAT